MGKEAPTLDAGPHNQPSRCGCTLARRPIGNAAATDERLEHEIDAILADASAVVRAAPGINRAKVIKVLVADNRKKLLRLQSYLVMLEERVGREAIKSD